MKKTMKLYLINQYDAYTASEHGIRAVRNLPVETAYYKHEVLEEADINLPDGFTLESTQGQGSEIFKGNEAADMITEFVAGIYVTELVTSDGIVPLKIWEYSL